jgi:formylglycine-generating enzyme
VPLDNPGRWWVYVPGASWRHPWGLRSDNCQRADHPLTHVAYEDAEAYAEWAGGRLPSEAEWDDTARGGLDGAVFAWGDAQRPWW